MLTKEQVQEIAGAVLDPVLNLPLSEFKAIKNVVVDGDAVAVTVCPGYPVKSVAEELASRVKTALTQAGAASALVTVSGDIIAHRVQRTLKTMAGVPFNELSLRRANSLHALLSNDSQFVLDPIPNLYFTRDPFAVIGTGVSLHKMHTETRSRETLFGKFIFTYHPLYKNAPKWYDRGETSSIEGGDILILSPQVLAVGISQRTREDSIDKFAQTVLSYDGTFQKVLAFDIPKTRSFMHLDTVFTMVDRDKFTVHPNILREITVYVMELEGEKVRIREEQGTLENILKEHLGLDQVTLIKCGSDSVVDAAREQWSDGSNTLAIAPGEVVVYERNQVTNRLLEDHGVKTHVIPCSELSRGRGGPRCMSMPFVREDL